MVNAELHSAESMPVAPFRITAKSKVPPLERGSDERWREPLAWRKMHIAVFVRRALIGSGSAGSARRCLADRRLRLTARNHQ